MASILSFKQAILKGQPIKPKLRRPPIGENRPRNGFGLKEIFLPNFKITFIRSPFLPPKFASFWVPLTFNKLDMRDYMFHLYGVRALSVRSFVQQTPAGFQVDNKKKGMMRLPAKFWHRRRAKKKMTIEMDKPFIWPEPPTDFEPWDKEAFDVSEAAAMLAQDRAVKKQPTKLNFKTRKQMAERASRVVDYDRLRVAARAKRLLSGEDKWVPTRDVFQKG
ncbi:MAG: hypothetical protein M1814_006092 [Vezdaea aestivalis]|nr:MAG: hypothetical protein M1814_006092 [Vezdaea aestivalis]